MSLQVDLSDQYIDLLDGHYDMALRLGQSDLPGLIAQPIGESRVVLCASPEYLRRHGTPMHPMQLAAHECLVYRHPALGDSWVLKRMASAMPSSAKGGWAATTGAVARGLPGRARGDCLPVLERAAVFARGAAAGVSRRLCVRSQSPGRAVAGGVPEYPAGDAQDRGVHRTPAHVLERGGMSARSGEGA